MTIIICVAGEDSVSRSVRFGGFDLVWRILAESDEFFLGVLLFNEAVFMKSHTIGLFAAFCATFSRIARGLELFCSVHAFY